MRDDEIFTTAASAGLSTGANPMAFGAPAGMLGAAATTKAGTAVEDESCLAQSESAAPATPPTTNTEEITMIAIERLTSNILGISFRISEDDERRR
jgi:hypothetical protein